MKTSLQKIMITSLLLVLLSSNMVLAEQLEVENSSASITTEKEKTAEENSVRDSEDTASDHVLTPDGWYISTYFNDGIFRYELSSDHTYAIVLGLVNENNISYGLDIPATAYHPDLGRTLPITTIGEFAFSDCNNIIGSLNMPNSITSIRAGAFNGCKGLSGNLSLPSNLTILDANAFSECIGFTGELHIPSKLTYIGDYAFQKCSGFTGTLNIPTGIMRVGKYSFQGTKFNNIVIPSSLATIDNGAFFSMSNITQLDIPSTVLVIGDLAFAECKNVTKIVNNSSQTLKAGWFVNYSEKLVDENGNIYEFTDPLGTGIFTRYVPVSNIVLNKSSATLKKGNQITLNYSITPANASNQKVNWKSSDKRIASVATGGVVTGKKGGKVTITVITKDGQKTATCTVTVKSPVTGVKLNKTKLTLKKGKTYQLKATVKPKDATNPKVKWKSSKPNIVKVTSKGKITAKKAGKAVITVTTKDGSKTAKCKVTVK